jgi:hypothetical protein
VSVAPGAGERVMWRRAICVLGTDGCPRLSVAEHGHYRRDIGVGQAQR